MQQKYLGIDYGTVRIGLSISSGQIASPYKIIRNSADKATLNQLIDIIRKEDITTIVVGMPLGEDNKETKMSGIIAEFVRKLESRFVQEKLQIHIISWNETLTSYSAYEYLLQKGHSHKKVKEKLDMEAATIILQEYLDYGKSNS